MNTGIDEIVQTLKDWNDITGKHWRDFNDLLVVRAERLCANRFGVQRVSNQQALPEGCCCEVEVSGRNEYYFIFDLGQVQSFAETSMDYDVFIWIKSSIAITIFPAIVFLRITFYIAYCIAIEKSIKKFH